jgi:hypothetical protein
MSRPEKVSSAHLERVAVVYVRQSTLAQVRQHTESTQRQYALADEAQRLGWPAARVEVIDDDLGPRRAARRMDGRASASWSGASASARSARSWDSRSRAWRAPRPTCSGCSSLRG